ncbi:uncharacterized protein LOC100203711 isoform X2 [Hydra vulgaris]|uniref:uncharacterized protein LOC100203711 isoform X2 n=1 Tax=Hydra vulgaris TaxID=6087 RepID=UPI001F5F76C2|nr:uncharacterized protein LOC100203711 isoform X3 [Hydra vulgaris]
MLLDCSTDSPSISQVDDSAVDFKNEATYHENADKFLNNFNFSNDHDFFQSLDDLSQDDDQNSNLENSNLEQLSLKDKLILWYIQYNVSKNAFSALLKIIGPDNNLPICAATLLRKIKCYNKNYTNANKSYHYFGIQDNIKNRIDAGLNAELIPEGSQYQKLKQDVYVDGGETLVSLAINVDGVKLQNSTNKSMWPILCRVNESLDQTPFVAVEFIEEDGSVDYVCECWLVGETQCWWPPYKGTRINRVRTKCEIPGDDWSLVGVRILGEAVDDEKTAKTRAKQAKDSSSFEEKAPESRKKFLTSRYECGSTSENPKGQTNKANNLFSPMSSAMSNSNESSLSFSKVTSEFPFTTNKMLPPLKHLNSSNSSCKSATELISKLHSQEKSWGAHPVIEVKCVSTNTNSEINDVKRRLTSIEYEIKQLKNIMMEVKGLLQERNTPISNPITFNVVSSPEEFRVLIDRLKDVEIRKDFVQWLSYSNAATLEKSISRMMSSLFTSEMAKETNRSGKMAMN